ncbi:hypothetical protein DFJ73DRAFT_957460, partial [Zopfochytrium polystomum]
MTLMGSKTATTPTLGLSVRRRPYHARCTALVALVVGASLVWLLLLASPAAAGNTVSAPAANGAAKTGKPKSRWDILKSSMQKVGNRAESDAIGVANGLASDAVGTAVSAAAGGTAGSAAKIGTGAVLGAVEEGGKALQKKGSFRTAVKFPLESIGNALTDGKSVSASLAAGADALSGDGDKTGWKEDPKAPKRTPKQVAGHLAVAAGEGVANKVGPLVAAGAATLAGGPVGEQSPVPPCSAFFIFKRGHRTAGVAAGVGTAAVMGFAEGVGHGLAHHEPGKQVIKDGLGRMGEVSASTVPGGAFVRAGIHAAAADAKNGASFG